jgi:trehalose 6-phosphate phosphatase
MQHVFSPPGDAHLAATLSAMPLLAFDFDGTLAPIVTRPDRARMAPGVASRLMTLSGHLPVAIVTGREIADVRPRLGFAPRYIVGSHGAENEFGIDDGQWQQALQEARAWLNPYQSELQQLGVQVEDKRHSIALHFRLAPDQERARRRLEEILRGAGSALHVFGGKRVFNIVAAMAPDKADAVNSLAMLAQREVAVFVGDDVNDEPVFERAPPSWMTIKVGRTDPSSAARFYLDSPNEVAMLLDRMIRLLGVCEP